ncbi:MAG TPA: prolyl oligopeptidase family serine peptidase [Solirubrobacterales bacterium]|nr:prolyl oligopeptidase family serine peptidase [Solirubrobacterales bacterium]
MTRARQVAAPLLALLAAALCVVLLCPAAALAAEEASAGETTTVAAGGGETSQASPDVEGGVGVEGGGGIVGPAQRPQLLLIHGGSFLYDDPTFEPLTRARAVAAGFVPHYVTYPLGNLPAAVDKVREEARRLREKFGRDRVYAYGSSAGGTLAALLSGDGLVAAAVAKAPVSDLATWEWPIAKYGTEYWEGLGVDLADRQRLSPAARRQLEPLLIIQGRADHVVPPAMNEAFAARFKRVNLWLVAGGHTTERVRPFLITRAMNWLARIAAQNETASRKAAAGR